MRIVTSVAETLVRALLLHSVDCKITNFQVHYWLHYIMRCIRLSKLYLFLPIRTDNHITSDQIRFWSNALQHELLSRLMMYISMMNKIRIVDIIAVLLTNFILIMVTYLPSYILARFLINSYLLIYFLSCLHTWR